MSSGSGALFQSLLFLLLLMASPTIFHGPAIISVHAAAAAAADVAYDLKPVVGRGSLVVEETRRRLGSFQVCALCTCCGGPKNVCMPSPCCYSINCNIPNRPFGFCAFTPKSCNCIECHL